MNCVKYNNSLSKRPGSSLFSNPCFETFEKRSCLLNVKEREDLALGLYFVQSCSPTPRLGKKGRFPKVSFLGEGYHFGVPCRPRQTPQSRGSADREGFAGEAYSDDTTKTTQEKKVSKLATRGKGIANVSREDHLWKKGMRSSSLN